MAKRAQNARKRSLTPDRANTPGKSDAGASKPVATPATPPAAMGSFRTLIMPLFLVLSCPPAIVAVWIVAAHLDGSMWKLFSAEGLTALRTHWPMPSLRAGGILLLFAAWQALLLQVLPGKAVPGPVTAKGNVPMYKENGPLAYLLTHAAFLGASFGLGWFSPGILYEAFGEILITSSLFALLFCAFLTWKGVHRPSSSDSGSTGRWIFDYYWGTELHPTVFGMSLKQWINCRISMTGWTVLCVSYAAAQWQLYGTVSNSMIVAVALQWIYIFKFFIWERGYFASLDIMHDRFGFYICWGVLAWVPGLYTLSTLYLVKHPVQWSPIVAVGIFVAGCLSIWANYAADVQRQRVRDTGGKTLVWGKPPVLVKARYTTGDGKQRESLLLASGYWGVAAHFHYVFEIALAFCWTVAAGFTHVLPYFYVIFLTILLMDRARRDDLRCAAKYGEDWQKYRKIVRWRVLPGVY